MKTDTETNGASDIPIAIIGMGCLFPRSNGLHEYWRLLLEGEDAIGEVPPSHWSAGDYFDPDPKTPDHTYCTRGGFLSPVIFDPTEFGIPPKSLEATDTSQLLGLVAAKMALEDAGYVDGKNFARERTSVILGVTGTQELVVPLASRLGHPRWRQALQQAGVSPETSKAVIDGIAQSYVSWQENSFPGLLGNVVAGRICNRLNLGGTNCVVDAACASSMGAVHLALLELYAGRSDMVITGGVDTLNDIFMHMCFAKTRILSPTGDIRPFSQDADGTLLGEGVGLLVLKRLADAKHDGDRIYAVLRGIGSASDGRSQSIYAPNKEGQERCLQSAYAAAGIDPATVSLVEAHGTGTRVGDKVEFEALKTVFASRNGSSERCALGSVKSMIGHTKAAAGAAGLIKTVLALHHKVLPPTLKAQPPDAQLDIENSPFYLNTRSRPWFAGEGQPRRAGASAFGFGGSNFHVVLEESGPAKTDTAWDSQVEILALSADSKPALLEKLHRLQNDAASAYENDQFSVLAADTRREFSGEAAHRWLWAADHGTLRTRGPSAILTEALQTIGPDASDSRPVNRSIFYGKGPKNGGLAFLFPGQGSQYPDMGRDLVCRFPEAFAVLENANRHAEGERKLTDWIYPESPAARANQRPDGLTDTRIAQPAIGAVSLAMLRVLQRFELRPQALAGHSFGELTALAAAGRLPEPEFLKLAAARGRLMGDAGRRQPGGMTAVQAPLERIEDLIAEHGLDLVLANRNAPNQGVVSGSLAALKSFETLCRSQGIRSVRLPVSAAFHSPLVAEALKPFQEVAARIVFQSATIPVYANATAGIYPAEGDQSAALMARQLRQPVCFVEMIRAMHRDGMRMFVEIGPRKILSDLVSAILAEEPSVRTVALDASGGRHSGLYDLAEVLCALAAAGYGPNLRHWGNATRKKRSTRMQVRLSGANHVSPKTEVAPPPAPVKPRPSKNPTHNQQEPPPVLSAAAGNRHEDAIGIQTMNKDARFTSGDEFIRQAMAAVQQGLQTMQSLQEQTARAHEKFLETQKEASRTLQMMMDSTRRLAEPNAASPSLPATLPAAEGLENQTTAAPVNPGSIQREAADIPIDSIEKPAAAVAEDRPPSLPAADAKTQQPHSPALADATDAQTAGSAGSGRLLEVMLAVVGELTGYPVETIDPDMDIEADLGIDSIKRVEILSSLEERFPGLPTVPPDVLGRTKTLREIEALLDRETAADLIAPEGPSGRPTPSETAAKSAATTADAGPLLELVRKVVSDLTGYPTETIDPDMDIEADLGIDSIKRVEILSAVEERMPNLPPIAPEVLGRLKTLAQIVDQFQKGPAAEPNPADEMPTVQEPSQSAAPASQADPDGPPQPLDRYRLKAVKRRAASSHRGLTIPAGRKVFITDDGGGFAAAIAECLGKRGINTVLVSHDILRHRSQLPAAGGLILVTGPQTTLDTDYLKALFELARSQAEPLMASSAAGGALLATITRMDGSFGCDGEGIANPLQGALAGLAKTAALEWEGVRCRALDVAPNWTDVTAAAEAVAAELLETAATEPIEVGLDRDRRIVLEMETAALAETNPADVGLEDGDLVLVSGGARGIATAAARALADRVRLKLLLLGRSPAPEVEPEWLNGLETEAEIKKAILAHAFSDDRIPPRRLEAAYQRIVANRQVNRTLAAVRSAGSEAFYHSVDVRDREAVSRIAAERQREFGPVRALIHAAGVLQDRLIVDKTPEQFENVFSTKVEGLLVLLRAIESSQLKHLVLFSSVAGRSGNRGQADYAMANEALNKIARQLAVELPQVRVRAVNWGPWDGGMVQPALRREFERRGISLIPVNEGCNHLMGEMALKSSDVEIVVGAAQLSPSQTQPHLEVSTPPAVDPAEAELTLAFERDIDIETHPVLKSHVIAGRPVVPLALMAEWFGQSALHGNPGLILQGLEDMRVLKGIDIDGTAKRVRLMAGSPSRSGAHYEVPLEIRDANDRVLHCRARAILTDALDPSPDYQRPAALGGNGYKRSPDEVYEKILFHGPDLQGIRQIVHLSDHGMVAGVAAAPAPAAWMTSPLRKHWLSDPLVLDAAFQMASVWCYERIGAVSLPSYCAQYRQYRRYFPASGVSAVLEVEEATPRRLKGQFTFVDEENRVVARIVGYEAVVDPSLNRAFKPDGDPGRIESSLNAGTTMLQKRAATG